VRKILWIVLGLWLCGSPPALRADTLALGDGSSLSGDVVKFNDGGITLRQPDDTYTNVMWTKFSQDGLKQLAENPKIKPFVEPFIIVPLSERSQKSEIKIEPVQKLDLPPKPSLLGGLFSSSVGLFIMLLIYAANLYAGYEIAVCRSKSIAAVMGVAAVLPIVGPIIFLSLPEAAAPAPVEEQPVECTAAAQSFSVPGSVPEEIHIVEASWQKPGGDKPAPQIFQRGQFTFNRRFFETKFPGFFSVTRRAADKDMVLTVKTLRGEFIVQRIVRIAQDDVHFQIGLADASYEEMVPFVEIQEIQLKSKDA
jgi:hypothetical protein